MKKQKKMQKFCVAKFMLLITVYPWHAVSWSYEIGWYRN